MDTMNSATQVVSDHRSKGRVKRFLLRGAASLIAVAAVAQLTYTYSGSNQWENLGERKGVTIYSKKSPGSNLKQFKAIWRVRTTFSKFVMFAQKEDSDLQSGYYDIRDIETQGEKLIWSAWKQRFPSPFKPREFVTRNEFWQDPHSKELLFKVTAAPDRVPPDACCVRVPVMTNSWRLTPLNDGATEIEWFVDMDMGGFIPYFVQNVYQPSGMYNFAPKVQRYLDQEKYKDARYDWIQEAEPRQYTDVSRDSVAMKP
jgi:hypothetical protein